VPLAAVAAVEAPAKASKKASVPLAAAEADADAPPPAFRTNQVLAVPNADFKAPAALHGANLPYWFARVVRKNAKNPPVDGHVRLKYLRPSGVVSQTFRESSEVFDASIDSCVVVAARKDSNGVYTIPAGLDVNDPSPGDAAGGVKRSPLCGWDDQCHKSLEPGHLALCDYCE